MTLLPDVERELRRVAGTEPGGSRPARPARPARAGSPAHAPRARTGGVLALAVTLLALLIGAGFLVALHGAGRHGAASGGGSPVGAPAPREGRSGTFPGAPRTQARDGFRCREVPRNRYLPRRSGCLTVLRIPVAGTDRLDLVMLYAQLARRSGNGYLPGRYTLELVRPSGTIVRIRLPPGDAPPSIVRAGNVNGVPGDELTVLLDLISSGDTYGVVTADRGRLRLVRPLLSAGGDSVFEEGFACRPGRPPLVVSRVMEWLGGTGGTIHGRWRWTVTTDAWRGGSLRRVERRTFLRRGLPGRPAMTRGAGCGRVLGTTLR